MAARPGPSLGVFAFAALFCGVAVNALTGQAGHHHQSPLLQTRVVADRPSVDTSETGSTGLAAVPLVREVQEALAETGHYRAAVDGRPGPATEAAIRAFQVERGLKPEGAATPLVLSQIRQAAAIAPNPSPRPGDVASLGDRVADFEAPDESTDLAEDVPPAIAGLPEGELVRRIQTGLSSAKVAELSADGIAGEHTRSAIRTFQALEGMEITGSPDPDVLQRLIEIGAIQ